MTHQFALWYGHWNCVFQLGYYFTNIVFGATLGIVPIGEHPGVHMNLNLGFIRLAWDIYYCDHDHHVPVPAEQGEGISQDPHD